MTDSTYLYILYLTISHSGVAKGGRGGAVAPPIVSKTALVKSSNPGKYWGGGGGGGGEVSYESNRSKNFQTAHNYLIICVIFVDGNWK